MIRIAVALAFLYLPLAVLVAFSFSQSRVLAFPITGVTLDWYVELLDRKAVLVSLMNSLILAQIVGFAAMLLGLSTALGLSAPRLRFRQMSFVIIMAPFAIPKAVLAIAMIMMLSTVGLARGAMPLAAAHILMTLPYTTIILYAALARMDPRLIEAARDLGASPLYAFRKITLPLLRPALTAAYSLAAILSVSDLTLATYLSGRFQTLAVTVSSAFRTELTPDLNALQALILMVIGLVAVLNLYRRRDETAP